MRRKGFTLIELLVVMSIIGILLAFILQAFLGASRSAERAATQSLITKLDAAMSDRLDALMTQRVTPTYYHRQLAAIYLGSDGVWQYNEAPYIDPTKIFVPAAYPIWPFWDPSQSKSYYMLSEARAQSIAMFDYIKAQLPDSFSITSGTTPGGTASYPFTFCANALRRPNSTNFELPLGCDLPSVSGLVNHPAVPQTGAYGAAFEVAGAIYKNLGYAPQGYDGIDNNHDGVTDDWHEGVTGLSAADQALIVTRIANHRLHPETARAEMLYAILVEAGGALGSSLNKDDFTNKEVQDTDNDGLPEFVDAWGHPLQFFRWPILYKCDTIKGYPDSTKIQEFVAAKNSPGPYDSVYDTREINPLDPNNTLMAPAWWLGKAAGGMGINYGPSGANASTPYSENAALFMNYFGPLLLEPLAASETGGNPTFFWDRSASNLHPRRAYYSRPLILSGGPDGIPGVGMLNTNYYTMEDRTDIPLPDGTTVKFKFRDLTGKTALPVTSGNLLNIEGAAGRLDPNRPSPYFAPTGAGYRNDTTTFIEQAASDDIANLNENAPISAVSR
ncbi:type II secretion system protein [Singulisphaera sp. PoT]|uniref:type II secretion system protein n=1 Tax=Singulisphaera sp. PoT TaxID=3411797 RepID=UPI003BF5250B